MSPAHATTGLTHHASRSVVWRGTAFLFLAFDPVSVLGRKGHQAGARDGQAPLFSLGSRWFPIMNSAFSFGFSVYEIIVRLTSSMLQLIGSGSMWGRPWYTIVHVQG